MRSAGLQHAWCSTRSASRFDVLQARKRGPCAVLAGRTLLKVAWLVLGAGYPGELATRMVLSSDVLQVGKYEPCGMLAGLNTNGDWTVVCLRMD